MNMEDKYQIGTWQHKVMKVADYLGHPKIILYIFALSVVSIIFFPAHPKYHWTINPEYQTCFSACDEDISERDKFCHDSCAFQEGEIVQLPSQDPSRDQN